MPTVNVNTELQKFLKDAQLYKDSIDGKIGNNTREAINDLLKTYKIDMTGWNNQRKYTASKQILLSLGNTIKNEA